MSEASKPSPLTPLPQAGEGNKDRSASEASRPSPLTPLPRAGEGNKDSGTTDAPKPPAPLPSPASGRGAGGEGNSLLERAKSLRTNQTDAEQRIWHYLRAHRFMGLKFKRQKPVGNYIVDFVCFEPRLVIELDGGQHAEQLAYDRGRDAFLQDQGFAVLRFWNNQVLSEMEAVLESIRQRVLALSPNPSPASGRGE